LTITRDLGLISSMVVTATAGNDRGSDSKTFTLNVSNDSTAPTLTAVADQAISSSQQTLDLPLSATGSPPLTYSATGQSMAYVVTQQTGTLTYDSRWDNWGGRREKWLEAANGQWYFILPTGELDRWNGAAGASGGPVGRVGSSYYIAPINLTNP